MHPNATQFLTWFPRVLALVFAAFLGLFALDAEEAGASGWHLLGHILIHLVPSAVVLATLWLAWHRRIIGGLVFMVLGMVFTVHFGTWRAAGLFWMFSMPLFVAGVAFIFSQYSTLKAKQ